VRYIYESAQMPMTYAEFELLLEITFALANDHGEQCIVLQASPSHPQHNHLHLLNCDLCWEVGGAG